MILRGQRPKDTLVIFGWQLSVAKFFGPLEFYSSQDMDNKCHEQEQVNRIVELYRQVQTNRLCRKTSNTNVEHQVLSRHQREGQLREEGEGEG